MPWIFNFNCWACAFVYAPFCLCIFSFNDHLKWKFENETKTSGLAQFDSPGGESIAVPLNIVYIRSICLWAAVVVRIGSIWNIWRSIPTILRLTAKQPHATIAGVWTVPIGSIHSNPCWSGTTKSNVIRIVALNQVHLHNRCGCNGLSRAHSCTTN